MLKEKILLFILISLFFVTGCSQKVIKPRVMNPPPEPRYTSQKTDSTTVSNSDSSEEFEDVEFYYALGVSANQGGEWTKAQDYFEKALDILSKLDIEEESDSLRTKKCNMLLHEIANDYKVTLLSLGVLSGESSIPAFLERFESIKNFKKLQEDFKKEGEMDTLEESLSLDQAVENLYNTPYDMPIEWNERVENAITYFQTVGRKAFETYLARSGKYADLMRNILEEKGLPLDLVWLCLVESGFNPKAYSWARAMGPWQFIASTGKKYGLRTNWWYDERRDFVKSTYAACDYFIFLYNKFNSWSLALAGYNGGEGRVEKAIQKHNTDNFWELKLRRQTEDYVPLYMAATIIAKDPEKYGFEVEYEEPLQFDIVEVDEPMDLGKVAKSVGTSVETMKELNPELLRGVTPPNCPGYKLRIPLGTKESFSVNLKENPSKVTSGLFAEHKVKKGETLSDISQKYGVPLSTIMEANALTKKHVLKIGERILIPSDNSPQNLKAQNSPKAKPTESKKVTFYTVKEGENLSQIAQKFGTTSEQVKKLNGLENQNFVKKGQSLKIPAKNAGKGVVFTEHQVKKGETLSYLAAQYGVSISAIMEANHLTDKHEIKTRQYLLIPTRFTLAQSDTQGAEKIGLSTVKRSDTASGLTLKLETSSQRIEDINGLQDLDHAKDGQKLKIPIAREEIDSRISEGKWIVYIVKQGDTLWDIARKFGVLVESLISWNRVRFPSQIQVGDRIKILQTY